MSQVIDNDDKPKVCAIFDFHGTVIDSCTNLYKAHIKVCEVFLKYLNELEIEINKTQLLEIISKAGGLTESAMDKIYIMRKNMHLADILLLERLLMYIQMLLDCLYIGKLHLPESVPFEGMVSQF